jgi:hypothetical protein
MGIRFFHFFCFSVWILVCHAGECTGNLDDEQVDLITWNVLAEQMNQRQEKWLVLGIVDSAISKLQSKFPQLTIISLDIPARSYPFYTRQDKQAVWENQYDKIVVYLALEKDPYREQKLRMMYKALTPGKDGVIICIRKDSPSIDRWVSQFAEAAELTSFISNTPNLSPEDYRTLFQDIGFYVTKEYPSISILTNIHDVTEWICSRWAIPLPMHSLFMIDFPRFMQGILSGDEIIYSELLVFRIRK